MSPRRGPLLAAVVTSTKPGEGYHRATAALLRARAPLVVLTVGGKHARLAVDLRPRGRDWTDEEHGQAALVLLPYQRREKARLLSAPCWTPHGVTVEELPSPSARLVAEALVRILGGPWPAPRHEARP